MELSRNSSACAVSHSQKALSRFAWAKCICSSASANSFRRSSTFVVDKSSKPSSHPCHNCNSRVDSSVPPTHYFNCAKPTEKIVFLMRNLRGSTTVPKKLLLLLSLSLSLLLLLLLLLFLPLSLSVSLSLSRCVSLYPTLPYSLSL